MVQIRKRSVFGTTPRHRRDKLSSIGAPLKSCLQFCLVSSVIPLMFYLRYTFWSDDEAAEVLTGHFSFLPKALNDYHAMHLKARQSSRKKPSLSSIESALLHSDIVELHHCPAIFSGGLDRNNFTHWATPLMNQSMVQYRQLANSTVDSRERHPFAALSNMEWRLIEQETVLQLLELYATHFGLCNFTQYKPTVPEIAASSDNQDDPKIILKTATKPPPSHAQLAIVIVAVQDVTHLSKLLQSVYQPYHYIVVHLEARADPAFRQQVRNAIEELGYTNVAILQFGTIFYETDSVSLIHLKIMRWLQQEVGLYYDFHVTLGGAAYPLYESEELARHMWDHALLASPKKKVWLGELTKTGVPVDDSQIHLLMRKRLVATRVSSGKGSIRIGQPFSDATIPDEISGFFNRRTTSGNQAVFSFDLVSQLLASAQVMQLFAMSKYGCCCCLEEYNWVAAVSLLGHQKEALESNGMFQLWGGEDQQCKASMKKSVLKKDPALCYRVEDQRLVRAVRRGSAYPPGSLYIYGNETLAFLKEAKRSGSLFARKFNSQVPNSVAMLEDIKEELHNK